jgi:hypothetical protein
VSRLTVDLEEQLKFAAEELGEYSYACFRREELVTCAAHAVGPEMGRRWK